MSNDNSNSNTNTNSNNQPPPDMQRPRRGSVTSAAFTNLFQRSNSTSTGTAVFPSAITTAAMTDQRRRLSISTLGLSGTSPTTQTPFGLRRGSLSTNNSDSVDENAIDEEEGPANARTAPTTPFTRRMSFGTQAIRGARQGGTSPGSSNGRPNAQPAATPSLQRRGTYAAPPTPPNSASSSWKSPNSLQASNTNRSRAASDMFSAARPDSGFNWSEQLRSRAESTVVSGPRPSFSFASGMSTSPPRSGAGPPNGAHHDRAKSVSDMPVPPAQAPKPRSPPREARPKPDHFQERILKGDFYMD